MSVLASALLALTTTALLQAPATPSLPAPDLGTVISSGLERCC